MKSSSQETLAHLAQTAITPSVKSFKEQFFAYSSGAYPNGELLLVALTSRFMPHNQNLPILIKQKNIHKLLYKHKLDKDTIVKIPVLLTSNVLCFDSGNNNNSTIVVCGNAGNASQNLIAVIRSNTKKGIYEINELSSVHYRSVEKLLNKSIRQYKHIYANENTREWVSANKHIMARALTSLLLSYSSTYELKMQVQRELELDAKGEQKERGYK